MVQDFRPTRGAGERPRRSSPRGPDGRCGIQPRDALLGSGHNLALGVGVVEIRKDRNADGDHGPGLLRRSTPPNNATRPLTVTPPSTAGVKDRLLRVPHDSKRCFAAARTDVEVVLRGE